MTEVDVINDEFIVAFNPPNEVFNEFVQLVGTTEGWAFQENDYEIWKNSYPKHWLFMVQQRETDKYVASISLAKSELRDGSPLFTVAFFYCLSEYRNKGFGKILFDKIHSIYGDLNCGLFGVGTMWQWYEKRYGFRQLQPYFHCSTEIDIRDLIIPEMEGIRGVSVEDVDFDKVLEYDEGICEMKRERVIESWLVSYGVHSKMAVNENGDCVGYGAVREVSLNRLAISPLYAESPQIASLILRSILDSFDFSSFQSLITVFPAVNSNVSTLLSPFCNGNFEMHEFSRSQFTQKLLKVDEKRVFAIRHCAHGYV